jgi:class 3 adenylate cyclase/tetratricopeptide (TPR) repeat protein
VSACAEGHENPAGARFCATCGLSLEARCSSCDATIAEEASFCPSCGAAIDVDQPRQAGATERRIVTVLFADVVRSTSLGESLDPEDLSDVFGHFFAAMREEIEAEGGTVEKFIGDAVMAAFGVPTAHEDDASRALRAALRMRGRLEDVNRDLESTHHVRLQMRIGVNTGEVLAAVSPKPGEPLVTGEAVIIAARLEEVAEADEILVSERTARAARGVTGLRDAGMRVLSGKAGEIRVFVQADGPPRPERGLVGLSSPMIGRDDELDLLRTLLQRVVSEGQPQLVTVYGEPGVGKSRLTREFLSAAEGSSPPPRVLRGRCLPYGDGVTYWPLAEILKGHAGVLDTDSADVALAKITDHVRPLLTEELTADPARSAAALAFTVGLHDPSTAFAELEPRQVRVETHAAWRAFFSALARSGPVIAIVEDIHWADPALLDLLDEVADKGDGALLLLCPSRPELTSTRPAWGGGRRNFSAIALDPLTPDESEELVRHLLTIDGLPASVHQRILSRAEGNPFFLEEIIGSLVDEGHIAREGTRWIAVEGIGDVVIPDTVQGVLAARVDLLEPAERRVLQAASVVGRVFWPGPLRRLLNGEGTTLDESLDVLEERDLVRSLLGTTLAGEVEYSFKHILTRDVAYESLPRRERARAHATVALWIEETAGQRAGEFGELLAYHYESAYRAAQDDPRADAAATETYRQRAFAELTQVSREARLRFAMQKALHLGERALEIATTDAERAEALERAGMGALGLGLGSAAWRYLCEAVDILATMGPQSRAALVRVCARAVEIPTRWPGAMAPPLPSEEEVGSYLQLGLSNLDDERTESGVRLRIAQAFVPFSSSGQRPFSDEEWEAAEAEAMRAAEIARSLNRVDLESAALDAAGSTFFGRGLYVDAVPVDDRRTGLLDELDDPGEIGDILAVSAWSRTMIGRYREGVRFCVEGVTKVAEFEEAPPVIQHLGSWEALCRLNLGEWDDVTDRLYPAVVAAFGDRAEDPPAFSLGLFASSAFIWSAQGDERSRPLVDLVARMAARWEAFPAIACWHGLLLARSGDAEGGLAFVKQARAESYDIFRPFAASVVSVLLAQTGSWDEVPAFMERSRAYVERSRVLALPAHLDRLEGRYLLARGDVPEAVETLRRAADGFQRLEMPWEHACTALSLAEALRRSDREEEATTRATAALAEFQRLRSISEIAAAREFLS